MENIGENQLKAGSFRRALWLNKPLVRLIREKGRWRKKEREIGEISVGASDIERIIRKYCEHLYLGASFLGQNILNLA